MIDGLGMSIGDPTGQEELQALIFLTNIGSAV